MNIVDKARAVIEQAVSQISTSEPGELWKLEPLLAAALAACAREAREEAAQKCEEWVITWKHEPETCDPCALGKTMAAQIRALERAVGESK